MTTASPAPARALPSAADLARNIEEVRARIGAAALRAGRDPAEVTLVAVSKTVPLEYLGLLDGLAELTDLGENRVQEAATKIEGLGLGRAVAWHLIGRLQSNKARVAVDLFDLIHSVDALDLAATVDRHARAAGKRQRVLFQVNVSGEESKGGFAPGELRAVAPALAALPNLQPEGLMTIAPLGAGDEALRNVFRSLRRLRDELVPAFPGPEWRHLSMGMTDDYELAVGEGATLARVGRALFGQRPPDKAGLDGKNAAAKIENRDI